MIIIFLGLPGSGKGTQSQFLKDKADMYYISTGDLIRQVVASNSNDSIKLNEYIKSGKLIPDDMINDMVKNFFNENQQDKHYLLDGYPRTIEQAEFLSKIIKIQYVAVYFQIDEKIIVKRISGRFSCLNCGKIYNKWYDKPLVENICNICQSQDFLRREDDSSDIVLKRIVEHKRELLPLVEYYKKLDVLHIINADEAIEKISLEVKHILKMI